MGQKIFLSVGRTFTQQQEDFVSSLEDFMEAQGVTPQSVGRTYFSSMQLLATPNAECNVIFLAAL